MKKKIVVLMIMSISICISLLAQDQTKKMEKAAHDAYQTLLKETDKNKDGKISKSEFLPIWKDQKIAEEKYKVWDVNKDGFITEAEYVKVIMDRSKKKK
jgi:Ca2+-binding EF-hand superfamily protein